MAGCALSVSQYCSILTDPGPIDTVCTICRASNFQSALQSGKYPDSERSELTQR